MSPEIEQIERMLAEFQTTTNTAHMENAFHAMVRLLCLGIDRSPMPMESRREQVREWLKLLAALERNLTPEASQSPVAFKTVAPPPGTVLYPYPVDPKVITNLKARAEYEATLKQSREAADRTRLQGELRRMEFRASSLLQKFLELFYTSSAADQKELNEILDQSKISAERKQKLKALIRSKKMTMGAPTE